MDRDRVRLAGVREMVHQLMRRRERVTGVSNP
jgi:hypothetical protein